MTTMLLKKRRACEQKNWNYLIFMVSHLNRGQFSMTIFGIIITVSYIAFIVFLRWSSFPGLQTMPLNEFGDFFAGVFGPLMLFWLILGYVQQQKELRQNTKALELQADELKKSVEQHKELVAATREQVQADLKALELEKIRELRKAQPTFTIKSAGRMYTSGKKLGFAISIFNSGQSASDVKFSSNPSVRQIQNTGVIHYFDTGQTHEIKWDSEKSGNTPKELTLIVKCKDANTRAYQKTFNLVLDEQNKYHTRTVDVG